MLLDIDPTELSKKLSREREFRHYEIFVICALIGFDFEKLTWFLAEEKEIYRHNIKDMTVQYCDKCFTEITMFLMISAVA